MGKLVRKAVGIWRVLLHLLSGSNRRKLRKVIADLLVEKEYPKIKTLFLMVGYTMSGKTWFIEHNLTLSQYFVISSRKIHAIINGVFPFLKDDNTVGGYAYYERQYLTSYVRYMVLRSALTKGIAVIADSANLASSKRAVQIDLARKFGYKAKIIYVECPTAILLNRIDRADADLVASGGKPVWFDLYYDTQIELFDEVSSREADQYIKVSGDQPSTLPQ
jgi:predicted kinase